MTNEQHDHRWQDVTAFMDTARVLVCTICGTTRTEEFNKE